MEDLLNIRRTLRKERIEHGVAAGLSEGKLQGAQAISQRTCGLCSINHAKYICPHCNVPYCSHACYTGPAHTTCADNFAQRTLNQARSLAAEANRTHNNANAPAAVVIGPERMAEQAEHDARAATEDQERARMMAILHRLEKFDVDNLGKDQGEGDDLDEAISENDLDSLTVEELMSLLEPEEVQEFKRFINDPHQSALIDDLPDEPGIPTTATPKPPAHKQPSTGNSLPESEDDDKPWWTLEDGLEPDGLAARLRTRSACDTRDFEHSLEHLTQTMVQRERESKLAQVRGDGTAASGATPADLRFNVFAVVLAYAFVVRQLELSSLCALLLQDSSRRALFDILDRLLPFMSPLAPRPSHTTSTTTASPRSGSASETVLSDVEHACQFFLSRLTARERGPQPTQLLQQTLSDVRAILARSHVQEIRAVGSPEDVREKDVDTIMSKLHSSPAPNPGPPFEGEAAQLKMASYPGLLSMGYDLYHLFGTYPAPDPHPQASEAPANPRHSKRSKPRHGELMQRKLIFYLASYLTSDASLPEAAPSFSALAGRRKPRTLMGQLEAQLAALETEAQRNDFEEDLRATSRFQQDASAADIVLLASGSKADKAGSKPRTMARFPACPLVQEVDPNPRESTTAKLAAEVPCPTTGSSQISPPASDAAGPAEPSSRLSDHPLPKPKPRRPTSFAALKAQRELGASTFKMAWPSASQDSMLQGPRK